jgi:putative nucleotidyltransferase with HDIG domain
MIQQHDKDYIVRLFPSIEKISDEGIRQKVILAWYNAWKHSNFRRIEDIHQLELARDRITYTNVDHTNQVCLACEKMAELLVKLLKIQINMDYLLAGAVLHDVDKAVIFDAKTGKWSNTGRQFAHPMMGASMALMEGLPEEVAHIIGAHSMKFSLIAPNSIEALIVRYVDNLIGESVYLLQGLDMEKILKE